jgi:site-specific DNA recombinase
MPSRRTSAVAPEGPPEEFLAVVRALARRHAREDQGRHAGGRAYGYRAVPGSPGELEIIEHEADVVRGIFADYVGGKSPRDIAASLNKRGIKPPRGNAWNASTINGNLQRGAGLLLNEIYIGRIVWNRVRMIKDPATGRRISRPNTPDQFRTADAPHLRIVADDLWQAAQARKRAHGRERGPSRPRTMRMPSGLMKCGACGSGMSSIGERYGTARLQCSRFKESGSCTNGRRIKRDDVERLTLSGLRRELAQPVYLAEYVNTYNEERRRLARDAGSQRSKLERRKGEIERELRRAIDAIIKVGIDPHTVAGDIKRLETERADIDHKLAEIESADNVIALHPAALERYRADLDRLAALLPRPDLGDGADELGTALRALVSSVIVYAPPNSDKIEVEIRGRLDELLSAPTFMRRSGGGICW